MSEDMAVKQFFSFQKPIEDEVKNLILTYEIWNVFYKKRKDHEFLDKSDDVDLRHLILRNAFYASSILSILRIWGYGENTLSLYKVKKLLEKEGVVDALAKREVYHMGDMIDDRIKGKKLSKESYKKEEYDAAICERIASIKECVSKFCAVESRGKRKVLVCFGDLNVMKEIRDKVIAHRDLNYESESTLDKLSNFTSMYKETIKIIRDILYIMGQHIDYIEGHQRLYAREAEKMHSLFQPSV